MRATLVQPAKQNSHRTPRITLQLADAADREAIYAARHEVYAREIGQHPINGNGRLTDALDRINVFLVAKIGAELAGFISVTPPGEQGFSIDKYFARSALSFSLEADAFEVRLLTVLAPHRGKEIASILMYAAFRWVESHGGKRIVAIGRREVVDLYLRVGLEETGLSVKSGAVTYDLLHAPVAAVRGRVDDLWNVVERLEEKTDWQLQFPFRRPAACFHGGDFFKALGESFDALAKREGIISADVLDAWFDPAPGVMEALREHLPWLLRTSPPTQCRGLIEAIAAARGVPPENILPGGGSSDLIFRALRQWLTAGSTALILDPTYGEYAHVLERVIGCTVDRLTLSPENDFDIDLGRLEAALADEYDLVVVVNPNSPTGRHVRRADLERVLRQAPGRTRVWVDETYIEYAGAGESLEGFAVQTENVIVCKSMSKVYALSGARVAYLCAGPAHLEELRALTPPWVVSLPAQVAAIGALRDPAYYEMRYDQTRKLREAFSTRLQTLGWKPVPGIANFLLCHLPKAGPDARTVVARCRERGLFLRDAALMGTQLGTHAMRVAVKDEQTNERIAAIIGEAVTQR
ncbi:MAG: aminotransferase class I/II-fold pyridoxal phosphate-dependent enzyme [Verrucomicrobia subdivision 3 bacterium]|nr:aminotransferase class I/II-fold pyridoxal phosphate-dependent enzyme [Limisphaerales bacterium]